MSIEKIEQEIVEEFSFFDDWTDKYEYIIEIGKELPLIDSNKKSDSYLVKGCQSNVWLTADFDGQKIQYSADSDAIITKGIISLLIKVLNNQTPQNILNAKLDFIKKIGLQEHLSPTRSNGLLGMIKQMKTYALVYAKKDL